MQNSQYFQRDLSAAAVAEIGGELLAGSGFETEDPGRTFLAAELDGEE